MGQCRTMSRILASVFMLNECYYYPAGCGLLSRIRYRPKIAVRVSFDISGDGLLDSCLVRMLSYHFYCCLCLIWTFGWDSYVDIYDIYIYI